MSHLKINAVFPIWKTANFSVSLLCRPASGRSISCFGHGGYEHPISNVFCQGYGRRIVRRFLRKGAGRSGTSCGIAWCHTVLREIRFEETQTQGVCHHTDGASSSWRRSQSWGAGVCRRPGRERLRPPGCQGYYIEERPEQIHPDVADDAAD